MFKKILLGVSTFAGYTYANSLDFDSI